MEALAMIDLLCDKYRDTKFWISFQCKDESSLANGENFATAALNVYEKVKARGCLHNLIAIGVNCVNPRFVSPLFTSVNGNRKDEDRVPLVVYPNNGEIYDAQAGWSGSNKCVTLEEYIPEWIELGVVVLGGCCRIYAKDIQRIRDIVLSLSKD